jgi:hypothetical protein
MANESVDIFNKNTIFFNADIYFRGQLKGTISHIIDIDCEFKDLKLQSV